jgi:hypothetical protein
MRKGKGEVDDQETIQSSDIPMEQRLGDEDRQEPESRKMSSQSSSHNSRSRADDHLRLVKALALIE